MGVHTVARANARGSLFEPGSPSECDDLGSTNTPANTLQIPASTNTGVGQLLGKSGREETSNLVVIFMAWAANRGPHLLQQQGRLDFPPDDTGKNLRIPNVAGVVAP